MSKPNNKVKYLLRIFLGSILLFGILLIFSKPVTNFISSQRTEDFRIHQLDRETVKKNQEMTPEDNPEKVSFDYEAVEPISPQAVMKSQFKSVDYPVIAELAIPSIDVSLPIFLGVSNDALLYGAGTLKPDQVMGQGNYALISHLSYDLSALFSPLSNIPMGAAIYLTDLENVYIYRASEKLEVRPDELWVLDDVIGHTLVTLITCADYEAQNRLVVQGELKEIIPFSEMTKEISQIFNL